jgi:hypothetical protein
VVGPATHVGMSRELTVRVIDRVREGLRNAGEKDGGERQCPLSDKDGFCCV